MSQPAVPWRTNARGQKTLTLAELKVVRGVTQPITGQPRPEPAGTTADDAPAEARADALIALHGYYNERLKDPVAAAMMVQAHVHSVLVVPDWNPGQGE